MPTEDLIARVQKSIDFVRPYLEADGGDVTLLEVTDDHHVKLMFHGACTNCSMSSMTLKAGLEGAIKEACPEIVGVEAVNI